MRQRAICGKLEAVTYMSLEHSVFNPDSTCQAPRNCMHACHMTTLYWQAMTSALTVIFFVTNVLSAKSLSACTTLSGPPLCVMLSCVLIPGEVCHFPSCRMATHDSSLMRYPACFGRSLLTSGGLHASGTNTSLHLLIKCYIAPGMSRHHDT